MMHVTLGEIQKLAIGRTGQCIDKAQLPSPVQQASCGICQGGVSQWYWDKREIEKFISELPAKEA
jgi:hypothetical protein